MTDARLNGETLHVGMLFADSEAGRYQACKSWMSPFGTSALGSGGARPYILLGYH